MNYLAVKNWERFQVHRDGRPLLFIKFMPAILDDYEFGALPDAAQCHLMKIWALAARTGNKIPRDPAWVRSRINVSEDVDLELLVQEGFLIPYNGRTEPVRPSSSRGGALPRQDKRRQDKKEAPDGALSASTPTTDAMPASPASPAPEGTTATSATQAAVTRIYTHWRKARSKVHPAYDRISPGRRQKIQTRLREFPEAELIRAIDAVALDPWEERSRHDDLTVIFRSQEQVQRFLEFAEEAALREDRGARLRRRMEEQGAA